MKIFLAGVLCVVILCLASCANNEEYPSIQSVSASWLTLKRGIINAEQTGAIAGNIGDFRRTLKDLETSPIISLYRIRHPENIQILADMDSAADLLNAALKEGRPVLPLMLEIDSQIEQLQLIEKNLSDAGHLQYFQFLFFLSLAFIGFVVALPALYNRLQKAEKREQQSLAFSRETIITQEQERSRAELERL